MGKKGKKAQAGKPKKLTPKDVGKSLDTLAKKCEEELKGADLFAPLPPTEDCAICLVPVFRLNSQTCYKACCGKTICVACVIGNKECIDKQNEEKNAGKKIAFTCPFCREPVPTDMEYNSQLQGRCLLNDHQAFELMGGLYLMGEHGIAKDDLKALDYHIRAIELGSPSACISIGHRYSEGIGVAVDEERVALFLRIGALRGDIQARYNIGVHEHKSGNHEIGIRHWKISAEAGDQDSLNLLKEIYNADGKLPGKEFITKDYLDFAHRACCEAQEEVKSEEREKHSGRSTEGL